mmetsp:Transcript_14330/g.35700  ORF Transcript_14330/g.35700 Transcript_14330/m.35700 type:complete len:204 (-) Transcript_14330:252-863(-)
MLFLRLGRRWRFGFVGLFFLHERFCRVRPVLGARFFLRPQFLRLLLPEYPLRLHFFLLRPLPLQFLFFLLLPELPLGLLALLSVVLYLSALFLLQPDALDFGLAVGQRLQQIGLVRCEGRILRRSGRVLHMAGFGFWFFLLGVRLFLLRDEVVRQLVQRRRRGSGRRRRSVLVFPVALHLFARGSALPLHLRPLVGRAVFHAA